jgi:hypothetical protein
MSWQKLLIPVSPDTHAEIYLPSRWLTPGEWDQFMAVLAAMKPGLVRKADAGITREDGDGR